MLACVANEGVDSPRYVGCPRDIFEVIINCRDMIKTQHGVFRDLLESKTINRTVLAAPLFVDFESLPSNCSWFAPAPRNASSSPNLDEKGGSPMSRGWRRGAQHPGRRPAEHGDLLHHQIRGNDGVAMFFSSPHSYTI
jgi:hypothetical protein